MKLVKRKTELVLTEEEKEILTKASGILNQIAEMMDRAISVEWSLFDDDEIWGACEIIDSFAGTDRGRE